MQRIYVITVQPQYAFLKISQEAYTSIEKAQRFIESRSDKPKKITPYHYAGIKYDYYINELCLC